LPQANQRTKFCDEETSHTSNLAGNGTLQQIIIWKRGVDQCTYIARHYEIEEKKKSEKGVSD
jgi:hypothetical protein